MNTYSPRMILTTCNRYKWSTIKTRHLQYNPPANPGKMNPRQSRR
jgi:hypothetical protein